MSSSAPSPLRVSTVPQHSKRIDTHPFLCPIDHRDQFRQVFSCTFRGKDYNLLACTTCGLECTFPQPSPEELPAFYDQSYHGARGVKFISLVQLLRRISIQKKIRRIESLVHHQTGRVMDIGAADGAFLFNIKQRNWDTSGIEISDSMLSQTRFHDLNIVIGDITQQQFPSQAYDVITLWHVFEHLADPREYLKQIQRILTPSGLLIMTLPNADSWQAHLFGRYWFHRDIPRHLFHYSPTTLSTLLNQYGFTIQRIDHFSLEYNPFGFIQSLFNVCYRDDNRFYGALKNAGWRTMLRHPLRAMLWGISTLLLIPIALCFSFAEAAARNGGTLKVYCRRAETV